MERVTLSKGELKQILAAIADVRVCLIGDVCLDAYWDADMRISQLSRETPHFPLPVTGERYSPGGAGNVAACIAALEPAALSVVSLVGDDWRGFVLSRCFEALGIGAGHLIQSKNRITPAYCKPIRHGISDVAYEDPRLDFENGNPLCPKDERLLIDALMRAAQAADIVAVSDQFAHGVVTPAVRKALAELGSGGKTVVVDSRDRIMLFGHAIIKPNELEAAAALGASTPDVVTADGYRDIAQRLGAKQNMPVIVTLGASGALWALGGDVVHAPSQPAEPPIDIVGAGDAFLSAFACAYGAGIDGARAIAFANLASAVTVKKIGTTGTASAREIVEKHGEGTR